MPPVHQHDRTAPRTDVALCGATVILTEDITDDVTLVTCERCRVAAALRCPTCGRGITNAMYVRGQRYHRGCEPPAA
jgi:hypothetical protein